VDTFQDTIKDFTLEQLNSLFAEKKAALDALAALPAPTLANANEATELQSNLRDIKAAQAALSSLASAGDEFAEKEPEPDETETVKGGSGNVEGEVHTQESPGANVPEGHVAPADGESDAPAVEAAATEEEKVETGGGVAALAAKTEAPALPAHRSRRSAVKINAAPDVSGFAAGQDLPELLDVANAVIGRSKGFPQPSADIARQFAGKGPQLQKFPTATFNLDFPDDLTVDARDNEATVDEAIRLATDESTLPGGSLVAAGGWCAPSETVYDLTQDASMDGMLSLPEIGVRRGGLRWPISPNFADFYANPGFIQTEAQAIAGTTKPCVEVDCPDFDEARLDVEGLCIKVPILTNVGFPEYVRNFIDGTLVAHAHWINANKIGRLVTAAGAARVITGLGSTADDTLAGLELLAEQTRQKYRLSLNASLEVVVPFWTRAAMREDLARRNGLDPRNAALNDAALKSLFRERKLNVQYVYDWQPLVETDEAYPATFNALMYPAGTFFVGSQPVINLSTVYDAAELQVNRYTGLFTEQAFLVGKRKFHADLITLPVCNAGRTGAPDLTCAA
jgi:hypothetical protein